MTNHLDSLRDALQFALPARKLEPFSDERFAGFHDGAEGVQWHVALNQVTGESQIAVNLEGLIYGKDRKRPIERLLKRERHNAKVFAAIHAAADPAHVMVHMTCDAWAGPRTRVPIQEWTIGLATADQLTEAAWQEMMAAALECLGEEGARGVRQVTRLGRSAPEPMEVVPHFNVSRPLWTTPPPPQECRKKVIEEMGRLKPVYDALVDRVAAY